MMKLPPAERYISLTVTKIDEPVRGFKTFTLLPSSSIRYTPGQYLTLVFDLNGLEVRRSYSLMTVPYADEALMIGVRRIENGVVSRILHDETRVGDILHTSGSGGLFTFREELPSVHTCFFFAAGSGITPIYSLIRHALISYPHYRLVLFYSNSSRTSTILLHELRQLQHENSDRLTIEFLFSDAPLISQARLNRENLLMYLDKYGGKDVHQLVCFVCGPVSYMNKVVFILQERGISADQIRRENFITDKNRAARQLPPDTGTHTAEIFFQGARYSVQVKYPQTILQAARLRHISLPFSCEAGSCGNCVAICKEGKIWHSRNEVLTEKDLDEGRILTCSAYPVGGDVRIWV